MIRAGSLVAALLALGLSACALTPTGPESAEAGVGSPPEQPDSQRSPLELAADELLAADRAFAAKSLEVGAPAAFARFFDAEGLQLSGNGEAQGPEAVRAALASGPPMILSWEPRYAEVFAPGFWGWTWGDWQAHEPGAGGRRVAQGRYVNLWKKQPDGNWKVRLDIGSPETAPR